MASSFEKSVKGATKIKVSKSYYVSVARQLAPPKTKYIEHILIATHAGEAGVGEVFRTLSLRLRDSTWTVVFKSLITIHLMIREGAPDATLSYLSRHRSMLAVSAFAEAQTQGRNIRHYASYLAERAKAYKDTKVDWVKAQETRLEKLSVDKGLLRETEIVQHQLTALLKCDVLDDPENEITITCFRLLVLDLLALFQVLNQAMINILGHFFEMSKPDAERAMAIYRTFTRQTDYVVQYLSTAREYEHHTRVEVPKLKHAPVNLGRQLEDYLKDPDFEIHRRQYLAELEAKRKGGASSSKTTSASTAAKPFPDVKEGGSSALESKPLPVSKGPDQDLIDFFDSIEQNQTPMAVQPQQTAQMNQATQWQANSPFGMPQQAGQLQANGFIPQQTGFPNNSPFQQQNTGAFNTQQLQPNFAGAGFNGMAPQQTFSPNGLSSIPQNSAVSSFQQPMQTGLQPGLQPGQQSTNPFRQSTLMAQPTGMTTFSNPSPAPALQRQSTNPFARPTTSPAATSAPSFTTASPNSLFASQPPVPAPLQAMATGTNPFARNYGAAQQAQQPPHSSGGLMPQPTGTNPFRQGAFVNHQTGMGWQNNQGAIGGGLDQLQTMPVFPRPQQGTAWQS